MNQSPSGPAGSGRFLTWLMLTTALCFLYLSMRPPEEADPAEQARQAAAEQLAKSDDPLMQPSLPTPQSDTGDAQSNEPGGEPASQNDSPGLPTFPEKLVTLGSMNPDKNFNLLVTLSSRGAGIEQAELVSQTSPGKFKYRALEYKGGYLGHLGLVESVSGLRIRTIPDGSPAALAQNSSGLSLEVGDIITEVAGFGIKNKLELAAALEDQKPGEPVDLKVQRGSDADVQSLSFKATLSEAPLDVLRTAEREPEFVLGNRSRTSLRTTLGSIDTTRIPPGQPAIPALLGTLESNWETRKLEVPGGEGVEFRLPLESYLQGSGKPGKLEIVKRYRLLPAGEDTDGYLLDLETTIENQNDTDVTLSFRQEGLSGLSLEGWWYSVKIGPYMFSGAGNRDAIFQRAGASGNDLITTRQIADHALKNPAEPDKILFGETESPESRTLNFIGIDSQYFNAAILPHSAVPDSLTSLARAGTSAIATPGQVKKSQMQATNVGFWFDTENKLVPAAAGPDAPGMVSQRYQVFIGPKDTEIVGHHGLDSAIYYGWFPWIAKPLSAVLHFFHMIVRNYGLSIMMLTVLVRGCMFPLGRKAALNAQKMQELQPELKKINEKYKDNLEKRTKAMQELYQKHNFKPLAGCLPMFIQLPIFLGLYRCLSVDISLRQEPLIPGLDWCGNLAAPDMLLDWSGWMPEFIAGKGTGWLGPYLNVLPLVTVGLFLLQQKMLMPKATDDQTRMTQNMMQIMTVFMGVLFFKVPSGLCIYFITSSLWSLVERKLIKRMTPAQAATPDEEPEQSADKKPSRKGKSRAERMQQEDKQTSKFQELMQMLEKPAVKSSTQRGPAKPPRPAKNKSRKKRR